MEHVETMVMCFGAALLAIVDQCIYYSISRDTQELSEQTSP